MADLVGVRSFTRDPANKERVADEIADVLLYLLQLADHADVDVEQAVERKLRKNAQKYPAKHASVNPALLAWVPAVAAAKTHLLVDWENVQPAGEVLKELVPEGTDVWLFHGPHQKLDDGSHRQIYGNHVTLVPRSGAGRNALDFQLTYYVGYISARQPDATFVVVSNDQGYDPMLAHARELGFKARRCSHPRPSVPPVVLAIAPLSAPSVLPAVAASAKEQSHPSFLKAASSRTQVIKSPASGEAKVRATRQDVQQLIRLLVGMAPHERPVQKDVLLALLQNNLGETRASSPRVAHALAQLQSLRQVALKKNGVSYPLQAAAMPAPARKAAAKKAAVPPEPRQPTAAQIARAVLASLEKMPNNKPTRRAGLLKFIETHANKAADPKSMAQQVCALLEARKDVVPALNGQCVIYPKMPTKKATRA